MGALNFAKKHEYKTRLKIEQKDDSSLYEQLLDIIIMALEIADMDEQKAQEYQKNRLENIGNE